MRTVICLETLAILVVASIFTAPVSAQLSSPIKIYAGGGINKQHQPSIFDDWYKSGRHLVAGAGYDVMPMVELIGSFEYHTFATDFADNVDSILGGTVGGGGLKAAMFGLQARVKPSLPMIPIKPYALAGLGLAKVTQSDFDWPPLTKIGAADFWQATLGLEDQTKLYYNFGGGVLYSLLPKVSLFAEARYTTIQIDGGDTAFDNPLRFWAVTAGVRLL